MNCMITKYRYIIEKVEVYVVFWSYLGNNVVIQCVPC